MLRKLITWRKDLWIFLAASLRHRFRRNLTYAFPLSASRIPSFDCIRLPLRSSLRRPSTTPVDETSRRKYERERENS